MGKNVFKFPDISYFLLFLSNKAKMLNNKQIYSTFKDIAWGINFDLLKTEKRKLRVNVNGSARPEDQHTYRKKILSGFVDLFFKISDTLEIELIGICGS